MLPGALDDRASDNWRPLIALADVAGGKWPGRARAAALALSGRRNDDGIAVAVLAAIKDLFAAQHTDRLGSKAIVAALTADPTARWSESNRGRPLSEAQLARLLRPFEIYPTSFGSARGYRLAECQDAFARYVLPDEVAETVKVSKPVVRQALSKSRKASKTAGRDGCENPPSTADRRATDALTPETRQTVPDLGACKNSWT